MNRGERRFQAETVAVQRRKRLPQWGGPIGKLRKCNQTCSCRRCRVSSYFRHREFDWKAERRNSVVE